MDMTVNRLLLILSVVLFALALVLELWGSPGKDVVTELTLGGLLSFAAGHVV